MNRPQLAKDKFLEGYNCAQAVAIAFCDLLEMDEKSVARLASGFGGGMGRMREVCGAVSGMVFVASYLYGYDDPKASTQKAELYGTIQELANSFREKNGSIVCRELLGLSTPGASAPTPEARTGEYYKKRPCADLVEIAAEILDDYINQK